MSRFIELHELPGTESKVTDADKRRITVDVDDIVCVGDKVVERKGVVDLGTLAAEPTSYALLVFRYNPVRPMAVSETYDEVMALMAGVGAEVNRASPLAAG